jgi:hypothetical protein
MASVNDDQAQLMGGNKETPKTEESGMHTYLVVGLWFFCAVTLSNALKYLFKTLSFKYPLTVTFGHMIFSNLAAYLYLVSTM